MIFIQVALNKGDIIPAKPAKISQAQEQGKRIPEQAVGRDPADPVIQNRKINQGVLFRVAMCYAAVDTCFLQRGNKCAHSKTGRRAVLPLGQE